MQAVARVFQATARLRITSCSLATGARQRKLEPCKYQYGCRYQYRYRYRYRYQCHPDSIQMLTQMPIQMQLPIQTQIEYSRRRIGDRWISHGGSGIARSHRTM